jgi:hypothetical protein
VGVLDAVLVGVRVGVMAGVEVRVGVDPVAAGNVDAKRNTRGACQLMAISLEA